MQNRLERLLLRRYIDRLDRIERIAASRFARGNVVSQMGRHLTAAHLRVYAMAADRALLRAHGDLRL